MRSILLRRLLVWAAPFVIGYIVKKYEERQERKQLEKN